MRIVRTFGNTNVRHNKMTQTIIQRMIDTKILILSKGQKFWYYSIIFFLLLIPVMTTIDVIKCYVNHTYNSTKPIDFTFGYIWILPALIFYLIQRHRLKFKTIDVSVDYDRFHHAVKQTAKELKWNISEMTNDFVIAQSGFNWKSWGERITIIHDKDKILFNSICDPGKRPSVTSFGMNKLNLRTFEQFIRSKCG